MDLPKFTPFMLRNQPDQTAYLLNKLSAGSGGGGGKLYNTTGTNTDGAMTQKATTDALGTKANAVDVGNALAGKVDKEPGKGLSTNDFTDADEAKLDGIEAGAQVNVQADWDEADTTADSYIQNKPTIPTNTSDLVNDSGFVTNTDYATNVTGGVLKITNSYGTNVNASGELQGTVVTGSNYPSMWNDALVSKGTLENALDLKNYLHPDTPGTPTTPTPTVGTSGIMDSAITTPKINDGAVTTAKINDGAVTADKIDFSTMPGNYSTSETLTGYTWTNGKPIYRRNFTGTVNVPADTLVNTTLWASSTIEDIVNVGGTMGYYPGTGAGRNFLPWAETDTTGTVTNFGMVYLAAATNDLIFRRFSKGQQRDNLPYNIWIEYTKTTDN